jgi:ATP/maltotriose-dependent transcriptional regulator MalT
VLTGRYDESENVLAQIEPAIQDHPALQVDWLAVQVFLSRARAQQARAIELAQQALELLESGNTVSRSLLMLSLTIAYWDVGQIHEAMASAREVLDQATQVVQKHHLPRLWGPEHVQIALAQDDLPRALHWFEQVQGDYGAAIHYPALPLERAKLAIAQGDRAGAAVLLAERYQAAARAGIRYAQIEIRILQALAASDEAQALELLAEALTMAQLEGYVRIFVDQGKALVPLLRRAAHRGIAPGYVARLLSAMAGSFGATPSLAQPLIEPLSEREIEVLQLLAAGKSNQAIAEELVLSVGTVKAHNSNIFGKLGVRSRTQAVARARELKLL